MYSYCVHSSQIEYFSFERNFLIEFVSDELRMASNAKIYSLDPTLFVVLKLIVMRIYLHPRMIVFSVVDIVIYELLC